MSRTTAFLLPDELGWECNDEINAMITKKLLKLGKLGVEAGGISSKGILLEITIAEIIDSSYAIIKKYQKRVK